jgi:regulatory protein
MYDDEALLLADAVDVADLPGQGKGPVRIRLELQQRGIDGQLVDEALDATAEDWAELAGRVRVRKFGARQPTDFPEKARQMRFLQYRGFDSEHIRRAVEESEQEASD